MEDLKSRARAILDAAASREGYELDELRRFARDAIASTPEGRLGLAVLAATAGAGLCVRVMVPQIRELETVTRRALGTTDIGRISLAVLDGGPFAPRRALELAVLILGGRP